MSSDIVKMLDELAALEIMYAHTSALHAEAMASVEAALEAASPTLAASKYIIEDQYNAFDTQTSEQMDALKDEIKAAVLECGTSVKGIGKQAVFSDGRWSVNRKAFDKLVLNHKAEPIANELLGLVEISKPSVTIRTVGKKEDEF
jgi:hypothetical protein